MEGQLSWTETREKTSRLRRSLWRSLNSVDEAPQRFTRNIISHRRLFTFHWRAFLSTPSWIYLLRNSRYIYCPPFHLRVQTPQRQHLCSGRSQLMSPSSQQTQTPTRSVWSRRVLRKPWRTSSATEALLSALASSTTSRQDFMLWLPSHFVLEWSYATLFVPVLVPRRLVLMEPEPSLYVSQLLFRVESCAAVREPVLSELATSQWACESPRRLSRDQIRPKLQTKWTTQRALEPCDESFSSAACRGSVTLRPWSGR